MKKKNGVKIIQTAGYNGARTVYEISFDPQKYPLNQACIYLLRICTIPRHYHEMRLLFPIFRMISFYYSSYKITWQVDYIHIYLFYIQLVSFQTKKIWEKETYFHYLSERLQLLHFCGHPCLQRVSQVGPVWVWGQNFIYKSFQLIKWAKINPQYKFHAEIFSFALP